MLNIIVLCIIVLGTLVYSAIVLYKIITTGVFSPKIVLTFIWSYCAIVLAYAVIYMYLPEKYFKIDVDTSNFSAIDTVIFWFYYSLLTFINADVGGISPVATWSKFFVILEILTKMLFGFLLVNSFVKITKNTK